MVTLFYPFYIYQFPINAFQIVTIKIDTLDINMHQPNNLYHTILKYVLSEWELKRI